MQLKTKVLTSLFIFFILFSCKEERGYEVINILSDSNNPTEQDIDSELGKRFSRSRENLETFNFYYNTPKELSEVVNKYDISIIKFRGLENFLKLEDLNKELPEIVLNYIHENYPKRVIELMDQNNISAVIPYEIMPIYLYLKDSVKDYTFNIKYDIELLDILDIYQYYLFTDLEQTGLLNRFKKDYESGKFNDGDFNAVISNENVFLSKYRDQNIDFKVAEDILFIDINGYISTDKNNSDFFQDFLMHLTSFSSGDYLYRRANIIPLIKDYKVNKLTTNNQKLYKRIQNDNRVYILSTSLLSNEMRKKEALLLKSFLSEKISIKEYLSTNKIIK